MNVNKYINLHLLSLLCAIAVSGCDAGSSSSTAQSATISYSSLNNNTTTMPINPDIYIMFNNPLSDSQAQESYIGGISLVDESGNKIPSNVVVSNDKRVAYLNLESSLQPLTKYNLVAPDGLTGNKKCIACAAAEYTLSSEPQVGSAVTEDSNHSRVFFLSEPVTSNFEYIANSAFGATEACQEAIEENANPAELSQVCFSGSTTNGVSAGDYLCETDPNNPNDGGKYSAFLTSQSQPVDINRQVLSFDKTYYYYSGNSSMPLFHTDNNGAIDLTFNIDDLTGDNGISGDWTYWTGSNSSGSATGNSCYDWSSASSTPSSSGFGQSGIIKASSNTIRSTPDEVYNNGENTNSCSVVTTCSSYSEDGSCIHGTNSIGALPLMCVQHYNEQPVVHLKDDVISEVMLIMLNRNMVLGTSLEFFMAKYIELLLSCNQGYSCNF